MAYGLKASSCHPLKRSVRSFKNWSLRTTCATSLEIVMKRESLNIPLSYIFLNRDIIRESVNASEEDAVIFTGSGSTGAINKLLNAMEMRGEKAKNTVVLVGPFEHHSNILPWKESGAKVRNIN